MKENSTTEAMPLFTGEVWFDPIEAELRERVRGFLEEMVEQEATAALGRSRYQRGACGGYRNGMRWRRLLGLIRTDRDRGSPRPAVRCGRDPPGMAERCSSALRADDPAG